MQVFSKSSHNEEDDEALKRPPALEKPQPPTYLCRKRGLLNENEVNIHCLGSMERKNLIERLVKVTGEDNEKFLLKLKDRIKRVGLDMPTIEVRFEHLNIEAEAYIGSRALPTIFNYTTNMLQGFLNYLRLLPSTKEPLPILQDVSGIIKPRRMTLLLGPPSSGKTTLLLALAGKLGKDLKFLGKVTYNGHEMDEFVPQRTSAYISQYDIHIGEMTVRETLTFSARCQGVGSRYEFLSELLRREKEAKIIPDSDIDMYMRAAALEGGETNVVIDYILKVLGLETCADTMVGDDMRRGISGGQKRRLTTGEMLVGPARAFFMDEISTGLDSSTTFEIVNSLRQSIHILNGTALISLLQPTPETYDLFDDLILLSNGRIVYHGPRENVLEFFEYLGFKCPPRKEVADFLQQVISRKDQEQYWCCMDKPYRFVSVNEFAEAFKSFHIGKSLGDELAIPFDKSKSDPAALGTNKYGISKKQVLKACISREILLMKRNSFVYLFKIIQTIILALIASSVFPRTMMHHDTIVDAATYFGALFYTIATLMFNGITELALTIMKLPVFYKQRDLLFYPSWAYALPTWILKIPITCVEVAIWLILTYYLIGFDPHIESFFKQYLLLLCTNQMASGLFRLIAAIGRNLIVANIIGSFALVAMLVLGGFVLSKDDVHMWWLWGYWASPLMYAQNAISVNEFLGESWRVPALFTTEPLGVNFLQRRGIFTDASWYWIGIGALFGYIILFNLLYTLALKYLDPFEKFQVVIAKEPSAKKNVNRTGQFVKLWRARKSFFQKGNESRKSISSDVQFVNASLNGVIENKRRGMVLPFQPLSMVFKNIKYAVDMPRGMKAQGVREDRLELLKGINGAFRPGVLTALMGVSGAGKTTLMDVLSGRKTSGYIEGSISISGYPKKQETFARISGYCEQNDIHSPFVTVYESLLYSAWLRLPPEVDSHSRMIFIEEVMQLVELTSLRGALVGLPGVDSLSIEQRKRLTIAVELVANPSIIFMDEPTSGLDARAAAIVMRTIRNTVDTGRTVVCTIHQPSIDIFYSFDELILLQRGGEEIFVGRLGQHSYNLIKYFEDIEGVPKIKDGYNPATWMLEITSEKQEAALGINYANIYRSSDLYRKNKALIEELSTPQPGSKDLYFHSQYSQPFLNQCVACLWKQHWSYLRNPPYTAVKLFFTTVIALMFGTIFWDLGCKRTTEQDIFNSIGSIYVGLLFIGIQNAVAVQPVVAIERTVFYRERAAGMYSAMPYAIGQVMIEAPYVVIQTFIYGVIVYAMIGFEWTTSKFFWYIFFLFFTFLYFSFYGMMTTAITPNHNIAAVLASAFYAFWTLFSGFIIPYTRIPIWWAWYYWCCPLAWTLYGLVASQFGDLKDIMDTGETVSGFLTSYFGFRHEFVSDCAMVIVGFCLLFCFIFAFSIRTLNFQRR